MARGQFIDGPLVSVIMLEVIEADVTLAMQIPIPSPADELRVRKNNLHPSSFRCYTLTFSFGVRGLRFGVARVDDLVAGYHQIAFASSVGSEVTYSAGSTPSYDII